MTKCNGHTPCHPAHYVTFTSAHNPSAYIGILLCLFLLALWAEQKRGIVLKRSKRGWEDK